VRHLSAFRLLATGWLAFALVSLMVAFLYASPATATATTLSAACSQTGDVCVAAKRLNGRVKLEIGLAADYFRGYRLCVRTPTGAKRCRRFRIGRLSRRNLPGDRVDLGRRFGSQRPGLYRARWKVGKATLAAPLMFRVGVRRSDVRRRGCPNLTGAGGPTRRTTGLRTHSVGCRSSRRQGRRGTFVFNGARGAKRPKRLSVAHMTSPRTGLPAYDETSIVARGLQWRRWGKRKAVGRGRIRYCVADYRPCRTYRGRVELAKRTPDFELPRLYTYNRARFLIRGVITTPWLVPWGA
jgi:hypothetical protein